MRELDKGSKNIVLNVESKEGERGPLSSNNANVRSSSLGVEQYLLSEETVSALSNLGEILRRIHIRLCKEGMVVDLEKAIKDHENGNCEN